MNLEKLLKDKRILGLILIGIIFLMATGAMTKLQTQHIGYLTGAQGLESQFDSFYFENAWWSSREKPLGPNPSSMSFGYSMDFDPDNKDSGYPDLCGSQQPITVQVDVAPMTYRWQYKVGETTLANGTIMSEYKVFEMFRYRCDWAINLWLSGAEGETAKHYPEPPRDIYWLPDYGSSKLWLKLVPRSFVYFLDNPDQVFFAPAYIGLERNVEWAGIDREGRIIANDPDIAKSQDLIPKAEGEVVGIYYQRGGVGSPDMTEGKLLSYQGSSLDPEIFRDEYWMRIDFLSFHPLSWFEWSIWHNWKFPSAYLKFMVYVFVVGEWTVYLKTGEVPELKPHEPIVITINPISDFLNSPYFPLLLTIIIFILIAVFAPSVIAMILLFLKDILKSRKK